MESFDGKCLKTVLIIWEYYILFFTPTEYVFALYLIVFYGI